MKKAIITGGSCFHHGLFNAVNGKFASMFDDRIYLPALHTAELSGFDCVVIASRLNLDFLLQNAQKLEDYLKSGGNIVSFGEVLAPYLPHICFSESEVNFWWWIHEGADLPLYAFEPQHSIWKYLSVKECKWHYHGTYDVDKGCEKILVDELGRSVLYKDSCHFKGTMYVTSLDPDYHIGQGFMPTTIPFLEKFMQWIEADIERSKNAKA
ncbi:MAG: hypothetical protein K2F85_01090 [Helicobacter sp.]|nr:hypothetical protein [Helicobacter sp.]